MFKINVTEALVGRRGYRMQVSDGEEVPEGSPSALPTPPLKAIVGNSIAVPDDLSLPTVVDPPSKAMKGFKFPVNQNKPALKEVCSEILMRSIPAETPKNLPNPWQFLTPVNDDEWTSKNDILASTESHFDDGYFSDATRCSASCESYDSLREYLPDFKELLPELSRSSESLRSDTGTALEKAVLLQQVMTPAKKSESRMFPTRVFRAVLLVSEERVHRATKVGGELVELCRHALTAFLGPQGYPHIRVVRSLNTSLFGLMHCGLAKPLQNGFKFQCQPGAVLILSSDAVELLPRFYHSSALLTHLALILKTDFDNLAVLQETAYMSVVGVSQLNFNNLRRGRNHKT